MKGLFSNRSKLTGTIAAALSLALVAGLAADSAVASNMGFKNHRQIAAQGSFPTGENLVALPFRNPYSTAEDICDALGLAPTTGEVLQIDASGGVIFSNSGCGLGDFALLDRVGVIVRNLTATSGMIVGSHQGNPPGSITIYTQGSFPVGRNDFPVPYHTTAVDSEDVCADLGIPLDLSSGEIQRIDAAAGVIETHTCGGGNLPNGFALRLGESVRATQTTGAPINVPPGRPAHF